MYSNLYPSVSKREVFKKSVKNFTPPLDPPSGEKFGRIIV